MRYLSLILLALSIIPCQGCSKNAGKNFGRVEGSLVSIVDGDTIRASISGSNQTIRLIGIDTPESRYSSKAKRDSKRSGKDLASIYELGKKSTDFLRTLVAPGDRVYLEYDAEKRETRGSRLLAYVYLESGVMLNEVLVRSGYALPYTVPPNIKYEDKFVRAAKDAREMRVGLWNE